MAGAGAVRGRDLAALLVRRLRESGQEEEASISVAELHRTLIPYAACRDEVGFATKAEYDLALLHLLRDAEVVRITEPRLTEAVKKELKSPEPGLAFLKDFAASPLEIRMPGGEDRPPGREDRPPAGQERADGDGAGRTAPEPDPEERVPSAGEWLASLEQPAEGASRGDAPGDADASPERRQPEAAPPEAAPPEPDAATEPAIPPARCRECDAELPRRPGVRYCPHCGADQTVRRCRGCGERLESGWKYCPRCGAAVEGS